MTAEWKAERDRIIAYGKSVRDGSNKETGRYQFRPRKRAKPQVTDGVSSNPFSCSKNKSIELQPPKKVRRRMESSRKPQ